MSKQTIDPSRRGFLTGALLTREGKQQVKKQIHRSGIIPPGLQGTVLNGFCDDCAGYCASECPQKIIKLHPFSHDLKGQPYLDFSTNGCTFCGKCTEACPEQIGNETNQFSLGKAHLNQQQCYAWLGIICMSCISVCPEHLFKFDKMRKPSITLDACTGCGSCIKVCPATAINIVS